MVSMEEGPNECFTSLWDAVMSIDEATIWQQGLQNTGLSLLLQDSTMNNTVVLVPKDNGVLGCDSNLLRDENQWPYGECAERARKWLELFGQPGASSILMYHWIPNQTFMSLARAGEGTHTTLLDYAVRNDSKPGNTRLTSDISVSPGITVSLPGNLNTDPTLGFENAEIVGFRGLCDAGSGGIYILDRPVYPLGIHQANATSLPGLDGYCSDSILSVLSRHLSEKNSSLPEMESSVPLPSPFVSTFEGLIESSYPALPSLFNPMTNVTVFAPYTEKPLNVLNYVGLSMRDIVNFRQVLPPMTFLYLTHFVPGSYCPEDFRSGLTLQTVAGSILGRNDSLYIKQDVIDENMLHIKMLFGDEPGKEYNATYLGQACSAAVYTLDSFLTPWTSPVLNSTNASMPYESISNLPKISQQTELLNFDGVCQKNTLVNTINPSASDVPTYSDSPSPGVLVGIVLGSSITVLICIFILWLGLKVYKSRVEKKVACPSNVFKVSDPVNEDDGTRALSSLHLQGGTADHSIRSRMPVLDEIVLTEKEVSIDIDPASGKPILLGQGKFGRVVRGKLLGAEPVAIKCINGGIIRHKRQRNIQEEVHPHLKNVSLKTLAGNMTSFENLISDEDVAHEIALLKSCRSQYVVSFIGVVFRPKEVWLVTELLPSGDLWHALENSSPQKVTWYNGGFFIAMDVLAGLKYLHNKRIIHLDLKSSNILLRTSCVVDWCSCVPDGYNVNFRAKISDVGLSRMLPVSHEYIDGTKVGGTWNWCAPEILLCSKCTPAADMFSFGVVLWEICTGEIPLRGQMRHVRVPMECPQIVADLIQKCIGPHDPQDRPTASDAFEILSIFMQELISKK